MIQVWNQGVAFRPELAKQFADVATPVQTETQTGRTDSLVDNSLSSPCPQLSLDELGVLWQDHRRWVAAILMAYMPRWADLDDLLQEVALAIVRKGGEVRDKGAFKPWLRTVAINVARLAARKGNLREAVVAIDAVGGEVEPGWYGDQTTAGTFAGVAVGIVARISSGSGDTRDRDSASKQLAIDEEGQRLVAMARELPEGYGEPLLLKAVYGMSYREIGQVLELPETTVETRIARARRMLREACAKQSEGEGNGLDKNRQLRSS